MEGGRKGWREEVEGIEEAKGTACCLVYVCVLQIAEVSDIPWERVEFAKVCVCMLVLY